MIFDCGTNLNVKWYMKITLITFLGCNCSDSAEKFAQLIQCNFKHFKSSYGKCHNIYMFRYLMQNHTHIFVDYDGLFNWKHENAFHFINIWRF